MAKAHRLVAPRNRTLWRQFRFGGKKSAAHLFVAPVNGSAVSVCGAIRSAESNLLVPADSVSCCKNCEAWDEANRK